VVARSLDLEESPNSHDDVT